MLSKTLILSFYFSMSSYFRMSKNQRRSTACVSEGSDFAWVVVGTEALRFHVLQYREAENPRSSNPTSINRFN